MNLRPVLRSEYDRDIARLAVPAFGTLVAAPLYVLADTAIVGHLGTNELAGLALASNVLLTVHGLMIFLAYGTTASVARLIGGGREADAARASVQGVWLAVLLGAFFVAVVTFAGPWFLRWLGGEGAALAAGETYLSVSAFGIPFLLVSLAGAGAFHGRQNTRTPLVIALAGNAANLGIEVVLIYGLGFGIGASALATVVAQMGVGAVYGVRVIGWARALGQSLRVDWTQVRRLLVAGQPLVLRTLALRGSFTFATSVAARTGDGVVEVAAHQVATELWSTMALSLDAIAIAGQALTGRWLGAGLPERAKDAARRMIQLDVAVGGVLGLVILVARERIAGIFSDDPAVIATAAFIMIWVALSEPVNGYVFALDGILIGAGDFAYLGRSMMVVSLGFIALGSLVLVLDGGLGWLWTALTTFMVGRAVAVWWRWRSDRWLTVSPALPDRA